MKTKRRHQSSSEESEDSDVSQKSDSSSISDSDASSASEHRYKKKRKHADSSDSENVSDDQKRSRKRKHKKKKKKHGKRKKHESDDSESGEASSSVSEGEISSKKRRKHKQKHKYSKRAHSSSEREICEDRVDHRLHSVVKERQNSSVEDSPPARTYYQKEYHHSGQGHEYDREREVQRFYRGSSKEHKVYQEPNQYKDQSDRYYGKYDKSREKFVQNSQYHHDFNEDYDRRQKHYDEYKRHQRYDDRGPKEEYYIKQRESHYQPRPREDKRGHMKYIHYEQKVPKRRDYEDPRNGKDYGERRPHQEERYHVKEYPEKRERYQEEIHNLERTRDPRAADKRSRRPETGPPPEPPRHESRSRSIENRYREKQRVAKSGERVREEKYHEERRERIPRNEEREVRPKPFLKTQDRKSRFTNADENKDYSWGKVEVKNEETKEVEKDKPNFGLSGKLTADANTVNGVLIKYTEPDDAKQPKRRWRFYPFKGDKALPILYIHRQSAFLIGRDKKIVDIALEHPSISKQHAALQYRATPFKRPDNTQGRRIRPYIIDLDSANGTYVNNKRIEPRRYVELLERDVVKFGFSQREYVLLHENSKDDAQDDDQDAPGLGAGVNTTHQIKQDKRVKQETVEDGD